MGRSAKMPLRFSAATQNVARRLASSRRRSATSSSTSRTDSASACGMILLCLAECPPRTLVLAPIHVDRREALPGFRPQRRAWRFLGRHVEEFELATRALVRHAVRIAEQVEQDRGFLVVIALGRQQAAAPGRQSTSPRRSRSSRYAANSMSAVRGTRFPASSASRSAGWMFART